MCGALNCIVFLLLFNARQISTFDRFVGDLKRDIWNENAYRSVYLQRESSDQTYFPVLANGHLGFTALGDSIFMNGLYNGRKGNSHRARFPNYANLQVDYPNGGVLLNNTIAMDVRSGVFLSMKRWGSGGEAIQLVYPHRFYNRVVVHELFLKGDLTNFTITPQFGPESSDLHFNHSETIKLNEDIAINLKSGSTNEIENEHFQHSVQPFCVAMAKIFSKNEYYWERHIVAIDADCGAARKDLEDALKQYPQDLFNKHSQEWEQFWNDFNVEVDGDGNLNATIKHAMYYLASSLPSPNTNQPNRPFFGLSPTGLGRGNKADDYNGHSFWDTELWMFPVVFQMNANWAKDLLNYRYRQLDAARSNAKETGYWGARFPWESAFTGTDVTHPLYPEIYQQEIHISGDVSFAAQQYFVLTADFEWLRAEGCALAEGVAEFWSSRVEVDNATSGYDISGVMGPDEDHSSVKNDVFTNVLAAANLRFASIADGICQYMPDGDTKWLKIAEKLNITYDSKLDYHPQYKGYEPGTIIKQASVVLVGYPLMFPMNISTRINDLRTYEKAVRSSGPAMTWAMHSINELEVGNVTNANKAFKLAYEDYLTEPFKVWTENKRTVKNRGAYNFITGVGGFLQAVIFGYGGVKIHLNRMEVWRGVLPPGTTNLHLIGIKYMGFAFNVYITKDTTVIKCTLSNPMWHLLLIDGSTTFDVSNSTKHEIKSDKIELKVTIFISD